MNSQSYSLIIWRQFLKNKIAVAALVFVIILAAVAIFAPVIANDKPLVLKFNGKWYAPAIHPSRDLVEVDFQALSKDRAPSWCLMPPIPYSSGSYDLNYVLAPPSSKHWLGTDGNGRDVAAQLVWGARVSLTVGVVAVGIAVLIGVFLGALAGYYGGWVDILISRFMEIVICFPTFFLILAILAFVGPSIYNIMAAIGVTGWTGVARLVRGEFLKLRKREFVTAAVVSGAPNSRIIWRHLLPGSLGPVIVSASFGVAAAILAESALSFLGFGVPPSSPSWGSVLAEAQRFMDVAWWLTLAPGSAIFATIMSYNLVGEAALDALNPNLKT